MGGTYPGKRVATARRNRSGRAGNGDRLQAEGQVIDVRRDPQYARSRREAPQSPCTLASLGSLGSLRPLRAGESADGRGFLHAVGTRRLTRRSRCTLRSPCTLASLGSDWPWVSDRSLGSGQSGDTGSAAWSWGSGRSLDSGQPRGTRGSGESL